MRFSRTFLLAFAAAAATPLVSKLLVPRHAARIAKQCPRYRNRSVFHDLKSIVIATVKSSGEHDISLLSAGVAFYALFALFPALAAATWIFGLVANPAAIHEQLATMHDVLPQEAWQLIDQQLTALTTRSVTFSLTGLIGLGVAFYSARLAASSMIGALNKVYGIRETRGFIALNLAALLFTAMAIVILLLAVALLVAVPILFDFVGLSSVSGGLIRYLRWPALAALMVVTLAALYRFGPARRNAKWHWLSWGSATATAIWIAASFGFSWYVAAFNSYDKVYGSIGAVIVLLFWFWITAFCSLFGAELDNAIERRGCCCPE
jgi:membrane protein